ncbi:MAG: hypothetical protein AB7I13_13840 [Vicinamibacterales bacterium]
MHRTLCLLAVGLALAGSGVMSATSRVPSPAPDSPPTLDVLVDGRRVQQHAHQGRLYVEARKGKEYAIRIRNPYGVRVAVALSVDGLNTIDAKETTAGEARKWVLPPYGTVTIAGWQTSQTHARRFEFTTEERSYGRALGKVSNLGIISAVFYKERVAAAAMLDAPPDVRFRAEARRPSRPSEEAEASGQSMKESAERPAAAAPAPPSEPSSGRSSHGELARLDAYAATGMGRTTGHAVTQVSLDIEETPARRIDLRYEFRPQLVRLGVLHPAAAGGDPLRRRESAHGFTPEFCPVP